MQACLFLVDYYSLTPTEQNTVLDYLFHSSIAGTVNLKELSENIRFSDGRVCPFCGYVHIVRNGRRKDGIPKFLCKDCGLYFVTTSNSIVSETRKSLAVWEKFVHCMLDGFSIRKTADVCGISKNTAFVWRHKVLDTLASLIPKLDGIIEADETFFDVSYKGNHTRSVFVMPRKAHKRGSSSKKRGISSDKVCVPCAVNRAGHSIACVSNLARAKTAGLEAVFSGRIENGSDLITDKEHAYKRFAKNNGLKLHQLKSELDSRKGIFHLQHINSYHSQLKGFIRRFNGVSTKYLNNYLMWHNFVNFAKETHQEKRRILLVCMISVQLKIRFIDVSKRSELPLLA